MVDLVEDRDIKKVRVIENINQMRTYWKIRLNHNRLPTQDYYSFVYMWTDEPLIPEWIPQEAVKQGMMLENFLPNVDQVCKITKEEYFTHMWE